MATIRVVAETSLCRTYGAGAAALFGFLHGFEVGFEGGAVLFLGFQLGLKFFYEQLEAADFVAQLLGVS